MTACPIIQHLTFNIQHRLLNVEGDRPSLTSSCPLPRHATFVRCVPGVRASGTFDSRARHPRLTSHCRCRGSVLRAHLESLITLELVRMLPAGEGWARISERECLTLGTMPRQRQGEVSWGGRARKSKGLSAPTPGTRALKYRAATAGPGKGRTTASYEP